MASADPSRRVEKVVGCWPSIMDPETWVLFAG
jgi:hypothetical protein